MASDIGIIGGADGPTAIILSGKPIVPAAVFLLAAAAVIVLVLLSGRKRNSLKAAKTAEDNATG